MWRPLANCYTKLAWFIHSLNERFFKGNFSRLGGLTKPKVFDEENPPLADPLALTSLNFLYESSRRRISEIAA